MYLVEKARSSDMEIIYRRILTPHKGGIKIEKEDSNKTHQLFCLLLLTLTNKKTE